jgi:hypothetical protein
VRPHRHGVSTTTDKAVGDPLQTDCGGGGRSSSHAYDGYPHSTGGGLASAGASRILHGAFGLFDGLAHEPRRHGVQLACVVVPGRSGGQEALTICLTGSIGTTVGLTTVEQWLWLAQLMTDRVEVIHRCQGVGMIVGDSDFGPEGRRGGAGVRRSEPQAAAATSLLLLNSLPIRPGIPLPNSPNTLLIALLPEQEPAA